MSSGELQGSSKCYDKSCGRLSSLGSQGCHRNHDCACPHSPGAGILTCPPSQMIIHGSSGEQQQRAESRAVQGSNSRKSVMNYLASNQGNSRPVPTTEQAKAGLVHQCGLVVSGQPRPLQFSRGHLSMLGPDAG